LYENTYPALSGEQDPKFCSAVEDAAVVRSMELRTEALTGIKKEFQVAASWHAARGRPELSEKYRRLAGVVHQVMTESLN
jgi:hypothetical protein